MAYDYTTGWTTSILVSGVDIRTKFGFQSTENTGRYNLRFRRRTIEYPLLHGVKSQGGTYEPFEIQVSGWMPKDQIRQFKQFLFTDVRLTNKTTNRKYIQFNDDNDSIYIYDTVTEFSIAPTTSHWYIDLDVKVSFTLSIVDSLGRDTIGTEILNFDTLFWPSFEAASTTSPEFIVAKITKELYSNHHKNVKIKLGKSTNFKLVSATHSCVTKFDGAISCVNVEGETSAGANDGLYAPTNILTDGYFDGGALDAAWVTSNATATLVGYATDADTNAFSYRLLYGNQGVKVKNSAANGYIEQTFTPAASTDYNVKVTIFRGALGSDPNVKIMDSVPTDVVSKSVTVSNEWTHIEFTFRSSAVILGAWRIRIQGALPATFYVLNRAVIALSSLNNGSFDDAVISTGWTVSGATLAQETTTVRTVNAGRITFNATGDFVRQAVAVTSQKVYHVSGWAHRVSGTGNLKLSGIGGTDDKNTLASIHKLSTGTFIRFSCFFNNNSGGSTVNVNLQTDVASTVIIIDDFNITELTKRTTGIYYEPGVFGNRLQIPIGEVAKILDFVNSKSLCAVAKYQPYLLTQQGSAMLFQLSRDDGNNISVLQEYHDATNFSFGLTYTEDLTTSTGEMYKINGTVFSNANPVMPFGLTKTAYSVGFNLNGAYDGGGVGNNSISLYGAMPDANYIPTIVTNLGTLDGKNSALKAYQTVLFGDCGAWDAFWCINHHMTEEDAIAEIMSADAPINKNKKMVYSGAIAANQNVIIDTERYKVDVGSVSAWSSITGDMLQFYGKKIVVYTDTAIRGFSLFSVGES